MAFITKIFEGDTAFTITAGETYFCQCFVRVIDNSNNELNLPLLNSITIDFIPSAGGISVIDLEDFTQADPLNEWVRIFKIVEPSASGTAKAGISVNSSAQGTNIEGYVDTFTVEGPLISRDLPFANNNKLTLGNSISKIESQVIDKLLEKSGKEKITITTKGYLDENSIYKFGAKQYIIGSQRIDEYSDINEVQLLEI